MTNTEQLNKLISESGMSKEVIAGKLHISLSSLNNKIANRTNFLLSELEALKRILKLDSKTFLSVFFKEKVSS